MAKDGTARGGARVGAGRKPKALAEKVTQGGTGPVLVFPEAADFKGENVPPVKDFLKADQKSGVKLCAEDVFRSTYLWLKERGCDRFVNTQLIEQYAMSVSRWVQCETMISEYGFLGKHPTTGAAITSPYVVMSQSYLKQVNQCWYQIYQIVKDNCSVEYGGANPHDDLMEHLLMAKKG
ncbi:P27 family phage terminase small subunit [Butyrivibrio sp. WCD2001]|uniref:P27 family phage terminase small subunit n=1 Tax=Butyrivibrio sp. WCD2001 TaxID=1280681 RepID=UPI0004193085|nr:P27 family phage terminase small subunit [Butyrivibrio sp. WCD2001]